MASSQVTPSETKTETGSLTKTLRRVLLYEVLLDEYESHTPSVPIEELAKLELGKSEVDHPPGTIRHQPPLPQEIVQNLRNMGDLFARQCEALPDDALREEFENHYNGDLVGMVLDLILKRQKETSEEYFNHLKSEYEAKVEDYCQTHGTNQTPETIDKVVVAHLQGTYDDHRDRYKRKLEKLNASGDAEAELRGTPEEAALGKVIKEDETEAFSVAKKEPDLNVGTTTEEVSDSSKPGARSNKSSSNGDLFYYLDQEKDVDRTVRAKRLDASTRRSALCLSGGGIRSATFNLGILQGLARHGLLGQFDYLSTVSGGGFAGGFLTAWMHRAGTDKVLEQLTAPPKSSLVTEPHPIDHLRVFGNYLSLRPGLLSADTWTLVATVLRNLLLTWLVFVPFLLIALMAPRIWVTMLAVNFSPSLTDFFFWFGLVAGWVSLGYTTYGLTKKRNDQVYSVGNYKIHELPFIKFCLIPALVFAMALALYWSRLSPTDQETTTWLEFFTFMVILVVPVWFVGYLIRVGPDAIDWITAQEDKAAQKTFVTFLAEPFIAILKTSFHLFLILLSQFIAGFLLYVMAKNLLPSYQEHPHLFATFAVPLLILNIALACTFIAGFYSGVTKDDDQEWWARHSAWFLILIVSWSAAHVLVIYGPRLVLSLAVTIYTLWQSGTWDAGWLESAAKIFTIAVGVLSGVITLTAGFSPKSPANADKAGSVGAGGVMLEKLSSAVAPIFLGFLIILLAIATNGLLRSRVAFWFVEWLPAISETERLRFLATSWRDHAMLLRTTPFFLLFAIGGLIAAVGGLMGFLINTNTFSLHYMWRNRIIRAYLGASREVRKPDSFTGFDVEDNIHMHELRKQPDGVIPPNLNGDKDKDQDKQEPEAPPVERPRKLFHVLNIALNLAGGDKLAWQDRKAESFTVSPLHVGSYWLGYRRSRVYGGERGISLGTAVAISGAFVSPNMGYMMTSPIVRFLMTIFNVRFGWWLGNPGPAGDKTHWWESFVGLNRWIFLGKRGGKPFELRSPVLSMWPIAQEAFGKTNDKARYVYLSDGGHFENLGLYEMVVRRCRFIVVSDASTDAGYSFDSLAQSIRQIRVDLGIPIEIDEMSIIPPSQDFRGKYCAIGRIRYSCADRKAGSDLHPEDYDGILIYIKASMIGEEPRDVINYEQSSKNFPQAFAISLAAISKARFTPDARNE